MDWKLIMKSVPELKKLARDANIPNRSKMNKDELVRALSAILPKETQHLVRALSPKQRPFSTGPTVKAKPKYRFKSVAKAIQSGIRISKGKRDSNAKLDYDDMLAGLDLVTMKDISNVQNGEMTLTTIEPQMYQDVLVLKKSDENLKYFYDDGTGIAVTGSGMDQWIKIPRNVSRLELMLNKGV
jgi:hypothetical protein